MQSTHRPVVIWLLTGCFLIYAMVVIGAITRLTGSGLSITEWKIVTGALPPLSEEAWEKEFEAYKQIPQYKIINAHFGLDDFKKIYFWEYLHRLLGRMIGIVFLIPFIWFLVKKKLPPGFLKKALALFALGGFQGFLGWFMVSSGLSENVYVSHYRLAIHLISAFMVFGFTFWYALDLTSPSTPSPHGRGKQPQLRKLAMMLFSVVILQIIYGSFVAGLKAGYAYPTWPKMGDSWVPDEITVLEPVWKNFVEGIAGVQFMHRSIAYVVAALSIYLYYRARQLRLNSGQMQAVNIIAITVMAQFTLGVLTLLYGVPVSLALLHQTGAFVLFGATICLIHKLK